MKKNGFTLVELLAVIAILGILVIVTVPNIINAVNTSKKNNFLSEAQGLYKQALNQYVLDRQKGNVNVTYQSGSNKLDVSSREGFEYKIKINTINVDLNTNPFGEDAIVYFYAGDKGSNNCISLGSETGTTAVEFESLTQAAVVPCE